MAKNTGRGFRRGALRDRSQAFNPRNSRWAKRNATTGRFINIKSNKKPFKGVRRESQ
jgi:hypothetical protein